MALVPGLTRAEKGDGFYVTPFLASSGYSIIAFAGQNALPGKNTMNSAAFIGAVKEDGF